jgi:NitT/TauT family transport system permease protein
MSTMSEPRELSWGAEATVGSGRRSWGDLLQRFWPPALGLVLMLAAWELAVFGFGLPNYVLPLPQEILGEAKGHAGVLWQDSRTTVFEAVTGFLIGSALGFALGIAMVMSPSVERYVLPVFVVINSVPMVAFGPLVIIWFGIGVMSKIVLIIVVVSYTVLLNTLAGLKACDPGAIALLRSFGASTLKIMLALRLPGALPSIFSGLRVAVVHAMILAVVIEMLGAHSGLGWSVYRSTQMMNFVEAWAAVLCSVMSSLVIYGLVSWAARRAIWWPH